MRHGWGTYTWPSGDKYEGQYNYGRESGGTYYHPDGSKEWTYRDSQGKWVD
jgi:hypothetical protein